FYAPFPNRIYLYLSPPQTENFGSYNRSWLEELISHELTHAFHINRIRGWPKIFRAIFGEWVLPASIVPLHITEGIATYAETRFTPGGRGRNPHFGMKLKAPLLADTFWQSDRMGYPGLSRLPVDRVYVSGYYWLEYLQATYGAGANVFPKILDRQVSRPFFGIGWATKQVTGQSTAKLYSDFVSLWRTKVITAKKRQDKNKVHRSEKIPLPFANDRFISRPLFISNDESIAYYSGYDNLPALIRIDTKSGTWRSLVSTGLANPRGFDVHPPTAKAIVSEIHRDPKYAALETARLFLIDLEKENKTELKSGLHCQHPRFSVDGAKIVGTKNLGPFSNLWLIDIETDTARQITFYDKSTLFDPVWLPDGKSIIFSRHQHGIQDLFMLEVENGLRIQLTSDGHAKFCPTISANGRYLAFVADYDGAFNIYVKDFADSSNSIRQVTDEISGAFDPAFTPDGRKLYFTIYTAAGYDLHYIEFDFQNLVTVSVDTVAAPARLPVTIPALKSRPYPGLKFIEPTCWLPVPWLPGAGPTAGALTFGMDPLAKQIWSAFSAFSLSDERWLWDFSYANNHFFPVCYIRANAYHQSRQYDLIGSKLYSADYKQRFTSFQFGLNANLTLSSNVIQSGLSANTGYRL
ncbi:MAG: hypothetical protein GY869_25370, partial [Planctomycetes bacterium]|nr:hypothetical protein [Planctomycetota bacterium]